MSTKSEEVEIEADTEATAVKHIGESRAKALGVESVKEVAAKASDELLDELEHITEEQAVEAVKNAREALNLNAYEPASEDDDEDDGGEIGEIEVESFDDADEFADSVGPQKTPADCEAVTIVAGDGVFFDGEHADLTKEEEAQLIHRRLMEFGFVEDGEYVFDEFYCAKRGMGRNGIVSWSQFTQHETDMELPTQNQIRVPNGDADYKDRVSARDDFMVEQSDAVLVVEEGDYVGSYIMKAWEHPDEKLIRTPEEEEEEEDDGVDWTDADE